MRIALVAGPLLFVVLAACAKAPPEPPSSDRSSAAAAATTASPTLTAQAAASVGTPAKAPTWTDPAGWKRNPPKSSMRVAEYVVPRAAGDDADAECVVYNFGPGQGGSADDNIARWKGQFTNASAPATQTREVSGMKVTRFEIAGTYGGGMPAPGQPQAGPKEHQRMIAAIVESPAGAYFFKMTGPDNTVQAAAPAFDALIASLK